MRGNLVRCDITGARAPPLDVLARTQSSATRLRDTRDVRQQHGGQGDSSDTVFDRKFYVYHSYLSTLNCSWGLLEGEKLIDMETISVERVVKRF